MEHRGLPYERFKKVFKSIKYRKITGHDYIESYIATKVYDEISDLLFMVFSSSSSESSDGKFPAQLIFYRF